MRVEGIPKKEAVDVAAVTARLRELAYSARSQRPALSPKPENVREVDSFDPANGLELRQFAEALEDVTLRLNSDVRLHVDDNTGRVIAQIIDCDTREIIRQIPPEELLHMAARLNDLVGLLFDAEG